MNFLNQIDKLEISDFELLAIDLISDYMSIDSEYQFFRSLSLYFKIEHSVCNCRKKKLFFYRKFLCKRLTRPIITQDYFIVDRMPWEVCKLSRSICQIIFDKGYFATQAKSYCGCKLPAVFAVDNVFTDFDLTNKNFIHDIDYQKDLFSSNQIGFEVSMRKNQFDYKFQTYIFKGLRKRIETLFSQLCNQFMIRINYVKLFN